ncbi:hypothetical protein GCM10029963_55410 [Micromonospora andamanensis]|nr:hypothetical protein Vwe01_01940 [Micromonospora andamanensis]
MENTVDNPPSPTPSRWLPEAPIGHYHQQQLLGVTAVPISSTPTSNTYAPFALLQPTHRDVTSDDSRRGYGVSAPDNYSPRAVRGLKQSKGCVGEVGGRDSKYSR